MELALYGIRLDTLGLPAGKLEAIASWGFSAVFARDPEAALIEAAHEAGLRVYCEFACFVGEQLWREFPESRPISKHGAPIDVVDWYAGVNPACEAVRERQLRALEHLVGERRIDGVWLDFIRWPGRWENPDPTPPETSFDAPTLDSFSRSTGIDLPRESPVEAAELILRDHEDEWRSWRAGVVVDWVERAAEVLKSRLPDVILGLFLVPWINSGPESAISKIFGQDILALSRTVDVFSPMVYHAMCGRPVDWIAQVTRRVAEQTRKAVWPIIQAVDKPASLPAAEYRRAVEAVAADEAATGLLLFQAGGALTGDRAPITRSIGTLIAGARREER
jgi:hypothetical protein